MDWVKNRIKELSVLQGYTNAKEVKATEIMTFVLTREQAVKFRERMGKASRKIRGWKNIEVRVFV